jgi:hypothetical protein
MSIVGHYASLAEAQKFVTDKLLAGLIEETIEEGQLASVLPLTEIDTRVLKYNREGVMQDASFFGIHDQIPWSRGATVVQKEAELKRALRQDILDEFIQSTYRDPNDYKTSMISQLRKGVMRTIEDRFIYGDATVNPKEFDGLHKIVAEENKAIHQGSSTTPGALSLRNMRILGDRVRPMGPDFYLVSRDFARRFDEVAQFGVQTGSTNATFSVGSVSFGTNELGKRITMFDLTPIVRTDYITETESIANGAFSSKTGGTGTTIFAVKLGDLLSGGLTMLVGGGSGSGPNLFRVREFDALEDYDAMGVRLVSYVAMALGSSHGIAAIDGIDATAPITL